MWRYLLPLFVFAGLVVFFVLGLQRDPSLVPSPLIDKPLPEFSLPLLQQPDHNMTAADLGGEVTLLNVWASWCVSCRYEHPLLMKMAQRDTVKLIGLAYDNNWHYLATGYGVWFLVEMLCFVALPSFLYAVGAMGPLAGKKRGAVTACTSSNAGQSGRASEWATRR